MKKWRNAMEIEIRAFGEKPYMESNRPTQGKRFVGCK